LVPLLFAGEASPCSIKLLNNKRFIYFYCINAI